MGQIIQIAGSLTILGAFLAAQRDWLDQKSFWYLIPNLLGSAVLAVEAGLEAQWGFLLLEGIWALVSVAGVVKVSAEGKRTSMTEDKVEVEASPACEAT